MSSESPKCARQGQYKFTTPPWKDVYRKRCLRRLQEGRSKLIHRFRGMEDGLCEKSHLVKEVMAEEWDALQKENNEFLSNRDSFDFNPFSLADKFIPDEDLNEVLDIMEEIQKELMLEEQLMLGKYEEGLKFEEDRLCAAIECLQTDELICPICKKNPLLQNKQIIFCSCGARIDTESDGITLNYVKTQLTESVEQHSKEGCLKEPVFSITSYPEVGVSNLLMACQNCDFLAVIL